MIAVRVIFVETTLPVRIRPRIEISPVNGHFLSIVTYAFNTYVPKCWGRTDICTVNSIGWCFETESDVFVPPPFFCRNFLSTCLTTIKYGVCESKVRRTSCFRILEQVLFLKSLLDLKFTV